MQGNSLLESFEGIDLSHIIKEEEIKYELENAQTNIFTNLPIDAQINFNFIKNNKPKLNELTKRYFNTTDKQTKENINKQIDNYLLQHIRYNLKIHEETLHHYIKIQQDTLNYKLEKYKNNIKQQQKLIEKSHETKETNRFNLMLETLKDKQKKLEILETKTERPYFLWHLYFKEVFDIGGFDIVIANPPYIQLQKYGGTLANLYENQNFETFERSGDIYTLFYEKGFNILKQNGISTFITSNKWMRAGYGEKIRTFFAEKTTPIKLIDFAGYQVFDSATVDTNIIFVQKNNDKIENHNFLACHINKDFTKQTPLHIYFEKNKIILNNLTAQAWTVSDNKTIFIKQQIEKIGKPLKEWDIKIYMGILNGFNQAFIIDESTKDKLIADDKNSINIIVPIIRGKDISKYNISFANLYQISIKAGWTNQNRNGEVAEIFFEKQYPAVYKHLKNIGDNIKGKGKGLYNRDNQGDYWWELRHCAYYNSLKTNKILWSEMTKESCFTWDESGYMTNQTCYFMPDADKYVLAFLNSKLVNFYFALISSGLGDGAFRWIKQFVELIPIPQFSAIEQKPFEILVDYILFIKEYMPQESVISGYFEQIIDGCVYELYFEESLKTHNKNILQFINASIIPLPFANNQELKANDEHIKTNYQHITSIFNKLYHSEHAVRQRLYYMDSVPEVRIIEGKEVH